MGNVPRQRISPQLNIARVVTGLWQVADLERGGRFVDRERGADALAHYAEAGLTTFDMADHYGSAEDIAGHFAARSESARVEFLTKWVPPPGRLSARDVREGVQRALTRLRRERVDLMQFHAWSYAHPGWLDALGHLTDLKREGLIGDIGATNFDTAHLHLALASGVPLVSNQVCFSLLDRRAAGEMSALCLTREVKLLAFGTLAGGLLSEKWLGKPRPAQELTWSQMKYLRFVDVTGTWEDFQHLLGTLHTQAQRLGTTIANLATRYVYDHPAVGAVIVGARLGHATHRDETLDLFHLTIDDEARRALQEAVGALRPIPGDCGDEYRKPPYLTASGDLSHHLDHFPTPYDVAERGGRVFASSGTVWEGAAGFARAVRDGDRVFVSGTTATHDARVVGGDDPIAQTHAVIDKIEGALLSLGASLRDVVRTRVYVRRLEDWEGVARAHGQRFAEFTPANTMVRADLIGDEYLVEMDAEAIVRPRP